MPAVESREKSGVSYAAIARYSLMAIAGSALLAEGLDVDEYLRYDVPIDTVGGVLLDPIYFGAGLGLTGSAALFGVPRVIQLISNRAEVSHASPEKAPRVRISVAAIAPRVRVAGSDPEKPAEHFGVMSHSDPNTFSAAGGAIRLTKKGKRYLKRKFGADNFEREEDGDARFTVPQDKHEAVLAFFENPDPRYFDIAPTDMLKELEKGSNDAAKGALTKADIARIKVVRIDTSRQPPAESEGTDAQDTNKPVNRRLFYRYEIVVPPDVYEKMKASPGIRFFTDEEVATTAGGTRVGVTHDGKKIGNNIYP